MPKASSTTHAFCVGVCVASQPLPLTAPPPSPLSLLKLLFPHAAIAKYAEAPTDKPKSEILRMEPPEKV
jgi:hypothetical protein